MHRPYGTRCSGPTAGAEAPAYIASSLRDGRTHARGQSRPIPRPPCFRHLIFFGAKSPKIYRSFRTRPRPAPAQHRTVCPKRARPATEPLLYPQTKARSPTEPFLCPKRGRPATESFLCPTFLCPQTRHAQHRTIPLPPNKARPATEPFLRPTFLCSKRARPATEPFLCPQTRHAPPPNHSSAPHSSAQIGTPRHRTIPMPLIPLPQKGTLRHRTIPLPHIPLPQK